MARLFLISEPNLYPEQDAYLPPHWCNLGTTQLAGTCRARGHEVTLQEFYATLLRASLETADGRAWLFGHVDDRSPMISRMLQDRGPGWSHDRLAEVAQTARHPDLGSFLYGPHLAGLSVLMRDVLGLLIRHRDEPDHPLLQTLVDAARAASPDWVGVSMTRVGEPLTQALVRRLADAGLSVVVGGSGLDGCGVEAHHHLLQECGARSLVVGPGEEPLCALLDGDRRPAATVVLRGGVPVFVGEGTARLPTERVDPAFDLLDLDAYYFPHRVLPLQLSHGCYWKRCAYCRKDVCGKRYVAFDPEEAAARVLRLAETYATEIFSINDESLAPDLAAAFAKAVNEQNAGRRNLRFFAGARPEKRFTAPVLGRLADAGFDLIFWGVESGSSRVLERMGKGTDPNTVAQVLRSAHTCGIVNLCFLMVGFPGETEADWEDTLSFLEQNASSIAGFRLNRFVLEPGSPIFDAPEAFGIEVIPPEGDSPEHGYRVLGKGISAERARRLRNTLLQDVAGGRLRARNDCYFSPPLPGDGDEPLPFFVAQVVEHARLLRAGEIPPPDADLIPLTPPARERLTLVAPTDRPERYWRSLVGRCLWRREPSSRVGIDVTATLRDDES